MSRAVSRAVEPARSAGGNHGGRIRHAGHRAYPQGRRAGFRVPGHGAQRLRHGTAQSQPRPVPGRRPPGYPAPTVKGRSPHLARARCRRGSAAAPHGGVGGRGRGTGRRDALPAGGTPGRGARHGPRPLHNGRSGHQACRGEPDQCDDPADRNGGRPERGRGDRQDPGGGCPLDRAFRPLGQSGIAGRLR